MLRSAAVCLMRRARGTVATRGLCAQPPAKAPTTTRPTEHFRVPGHRPSKTDRRVLLWSGRFKKDEDIPETVTAEMIEAARNRLRIRMCYIMIGITLIGCVLMVISGKKAANRHESLSGWNLEKKAQLKEELRREQAAASEAAAAIKAV